MNKVSSFIDNIHHIVRVMGYNAKAIHHVLQDEAFIQQKGWDNLYACCFVSILLCIIHLTGFIGTYAPEAAGAVLPRINAPTVYLSIFSVNVLFLCIFYYLLSHRQLYKKKMDGLVYSFLFINSSLACLTFFTTQDGSSFFFEYVLQLILVYLLPVYDNLKILSVIVAINLFTTFLVITLTGHQIVWQDRYDIVLFYLICMVIILFRRHLTFSFGQIRMHLQASSDEFYQRSRTDELTGLLNREALREDFSQYFGRELSVMICDVDQFKYYNDTYGHEQGDRILMAVSALLQDAFDAECVYRYGGDEFLVISPLMPDEFQFQVEYFRLRLHRTPFDESITRQPTISGGYTWGLCGSAIELRKMFAQADHLLYKAKDAGRNRVCYEAFDAQKAEASLHAIENMWDRSS